MPGMRVGEQQQTTGKREKREIDEGGLRWLCGDWPMAAGGVTQNGVMRRFLALRRSSHCHAFVVAVVLIVYFYCRTAFVLASLSFGARHCRASTGRTQSQHHFPVVLPTHVDCHCHGQHHDMTTTITIQPILSINHTHVRSGFLVSIAVLLHARRSSMIPAQMSRNLVSCLVRYAHRHSFPSPNLNHTCYCNSGG